MKGLYLLAGFHSAKALLLKDDELYRILLSLSPSPPSPPPHSISPPSLYLSPLSCALPCSPLSPSPLALPSRSPPSLLSLPISLFLSYYD
jgi:hypothetical protein